MSKEEFIQQVNNMEKMKVGGRKKRFLPYHYGEHQLQVSLKAYDLDGEVQKIREAEKNAKKLSLNDKKDWNELSLRGNIKIKEQTLKKVFPPLESPSATLLLTIHCPPTYLRKRHSITSKATADIHSFKISLRRHNLYGKVMIKAFLVRNKDSRKTYDAYATEKGMRLASSSVWAIYVDKLTSPIGAKYLTAIYENFSQTEYTPDGNHFYYLDLRNPAEPLLWLNSEIERVQGILNSKGTRGKDARLRELFFDLISGGVWSRLLLRAITDITEENEPLYQWEKTLLRTFIAEKFPDYKFSTAMAELREKIHSNEGVDDVMQNINSFIQTHSGVRAHMIELIKEVEEK